MRRLPALLLAAVLAPSALAQSAPDDARQRELVHMVRQDCGSCHGMHLTGGMGPPLPQAGLGPLTQPPQIVSMLEEDQQGDPRRGEDQPRAAVLPPSQPGAEGGESD